MSVDYSKTTYEHNFYKPIKKMGQTSILLYNNLWELTQEYYTNKFGFENPDVVRDCYASKGEKCAESIDEYFDLIGKDDINDNISFITRIFWDLRSGCWLADDNQASDIDEDILKMQVLNCRYFFALLMSLPIQMRVNRKYEEDLTMSWLPFFQKFHMKKIMLI